MPATATPAPLLRLAHAELCAACHDLLPVGAPVVVDATGAPTCLACTDEVPVGRLVRRDAWSVLDDPALRQRLQLRTGTTRRILALSA